MYSNCLFVYVSICNGRGDLTSLAKSPLYKLFWRICHTSGNGSLTGLYNRHITMGTLLRRQALLPGNGKHFYPGYGVVDAIL